MNRDFTSASRYEKEQKSGELRSLTSETCQAVASSISGMVSPKRPNSKDDKPKKQKTRQLTLKLSHLDGLGRNRKRVGMTSALIFGLYLVVTTRARKVSTHSFMSLSYHGRLLWHAIGVVDKSTTTVD